MSVKKQKLTVSLKYIPYNSRHFCRVFCSYLQNQDKINLVDINEESINKLFVYGIRYQNINILNWCLFYIQNLNIDEDYKLYITDTAAKIIIKYGRIRSIYWLMHNECNNIKLACDLPNYIADRMDKELHYQELMIFILGAAKRTFQKK